MKTTVRGLQASGKATNGQQWTGQIEADVRGEDSIMAELSEWKSQQLITHRENGKAAACSVNDRLCSRNTNCVQGQLMNRSPTMLPSLLLQNLWFPSDLYDARNSGTFLLSPSGTTVVLVQPFPLGNFDLLFCVLFGQILCKNYPFST